MWEKLNVATKILLTGSLLWVGSMVFKSDQRLRKALDEIDKAKAKIDSAKMDIDSARQNIAMVKSELGKLNDAANRATAELSALRAERLVMTRRFDNMITQSERLIDLNRKSYEDLKKMRLNILDELRKSGMLRTDAKQEK